MKIWRVAPLAVAALVLGVGARAEPPPMRITPEARSSASAPDPQKLALADRYMSDVHSDRLARSLFEEGVRRSMEAEFRRTNAGIPVIPDSMRQEMYAAALEATRALEPRLHDRMVRLLATEYTIEELQALVDFYETPVGRSIADKSIDISAAARRLAEDMGPQFLADFKRRFCAREPQCPTTSAAQPPG